MKTKNRFQSSFNTCCTVMLIVIVLAACSKPNVPIEMSSQSAEIAESAWSEEFSGPVDPQKWKIMNSAFGWGGKESQWYQGANLQVSNGTLKIVAKKETVSGRPEYLAPKVSFVSEDGVMRADPQKELPAGTRYWTAGMINTREAGTPKFFPLFGQFEMRGRLPHGQGLLPAFWLRRKGGASWAEVDIMEYFGAATPGRSKFTLHFPKSIGYNRYQQHVRFDENVQPGMSGWHTWSITIRPMKKNTDPLKDTVEFVGYMDGRQYGYYKVGDEKTLRILHMRDPDTGKPIEGESSSAVWDICVNMAVGGAWVGQPDQQLGYMPMPNRCTINGQRPPSGKPGSCSTTGLFFAKFPATFEVDYVRYRPSQVK